MKRNHNHIVSYQIANIYHNKISIKLQLIFHYNDVKHAKNLTKVSKS